MSLMNLFEEPPSRAAHGDHRNPDVPSIRLISAKPSASGRAQGSPFLGIFDEPVMASQSSPAPWDSIPQPPPPTAAPLKKKPSKLVPKASKTALSDASSSGAARLVPKKSKRRLLGSLGSALPNSNKENARGKDFSDVIRRVASGNASQQSLVGSAKLRGGFDIYVDPSADPEMSDILVVKKQKSRAALNSMGWGPAGVNVSRDALAEVTNHGHEVREKEVKGKEVKEGSGTLSKVKGEEDRKWWSIGRGRKELKDEKKEKENVEAVVPPKRSQTPDPFKGTNPETEQSRGRFNSLDAGILLGFGKKKSSNVLSFEEPTKPIAEPSSAAPSPPPTMRRKSYGNIASNPQLQPQTQNRRMERIPTPPQMTYSRSATPSLGGLFAGPTQDDASPSNDAPNQGSIALRAMRSVRSFARIGSRAGSKGEEGHKAEKEKKERKKSMDFGEVKGLNRRGTWRKEKDDTARRASGSSFEAGNLSSGSGQEQNGTLHKKRSVLGIGLPSSMKLPRLRSGSTASSIFVSQTPVPPVPRIPSQFATVNSAVLVVSADAAHDDTGTITKSRRSVDSDVTLDGRRASVKSTSSSLRPLSFTSTISGNSGGSHPSSGRCSSGASVRWDEAGLQRAKVEREKEFLGKRGSTKAGRQSKAKDTRGGTEPRKRTALSEIFPELAAAAPVAPSPPLPEPEAQRFPILTIDEAMSDGNGSETETPLAEESETDEGRNAGESEADSVDVSATPTRRARPRPLSEQLAGRPRPQAFYADEDGVLTILSAATNDLAQLINHLDLEATPRTPDMTPLKRSSTFSGQTSNTLSPSIEYDGSPLKQKTSTLRPDAKVISARPSIASISSLRPYGPPKAVNAGHATVRQKPSLAEMMLGKAIPSWPLPESTSLAALRAKLKPVAPPKPETTTSSRPIAKNVQPLTISKKTHKRTMTPVSEATPVAKPLSPPSSKRSTKVVKAKVTPERVKDTFDDSSEDEEKYRTLRAKAAAKGSSDTIFGSIASLRKRSTTSKASGGSKMSSSSSSSKAHTLVEERSVLMGRESRRMMLGMSGTLGGSTVSAYHAELNCNDPDSDVPEELRDILRNKSDAIPYHDANSLNEYGDGDYRDYSAFTSGLHTDDTDDDLTDTESMYSASPFNRHAMLRASTSFASMQGSVSGAEIHHAQRLPVLRAQLVSDSPGRCGDLDDSSSALSDDDATKKSFDFTGELAKLVKDTEFDSKSFVEEVEKAFNGPSRLELNPKYGMTLNVPPVPTLPDFVLKSFNSSSTLSSRNEGPSQSFESEGSMSVKEDARSVGSQSMDMQAPSFISEQLTTGRRSTGSSFLRSWDSGSALDVHQRLEMPSISASSASTIGTRKSKASLSSFASQPSDRHEGELNLSFKFGGLRRTSPSPPKVFVPPASDNLTDELNVNEFHGPQCKPLTLSDIIPPPSHVRKLSHSSSMFEDDSALKSFIAGFAVGPQGPSSEASPGCLPPRERTSSGGSMASTTSTRFIPLTRPSSGVSFAGMDSYDELRRGFEFHDQRPNWYPSPAAQAAAARTRARRHARDSVLSTTSVSSYGQVIRAGAPDPFNFGSVPPRHAMPARFDKPLPSLPSVDDWPQEEDGSRSSMCSDASSDISVQVEDTFSFLHQRPVPRRRVNSGGSSIYFNASTHMGRGNRRLSAASGFGIPPVSIYNRSFGHHRRSSSVTSASSIALAYAHGGIGGRAILARHRREASADSTRQFARPELGDKMFETAAPLPAIASPSESPYGDVVSRDYENRRFSTASSDYNDSIFDVDHAHRFDLRRNSIVEETEDDEFPSSRPDSLFEKSRNTSSASSGSLFGDDNSRYHFDESLPQQFSPISSMSVTEVHSPLKEDDTMLSLIGGGGRVRKRSVVSTIAASPCVRFDRKDDHRRAALAALQGNSKGSDIIASHPTSRPSQSDKAEVKPSIVPLTPAQLGESPVIRALRGGLLRRKATEETVLVATGEDNSVPVRTVPVFTRPPPVSRTRSSTCTTTSESSGRDTPPLSPDTSSMYGGSFSSIDMAELSASLSNASQPSSTLASARVRAQHQGHSHRRRYSRSQPYRSSVYETIDEEDMPSFSAPLSTEDTSTKKLPTGADDATAIYVVGSDTESVYDSETVGLWDDERGLVALRKFYHLKDEAQTTVDESRMTWLDTPASMFAVQTFDPPRQPEGMKAMLEHSINTYGPLPAELRRIRARKDSRPSPYPSTRFIQTSIAPPSPECYTSEPVEAPVSTTLGINTTFESRTTACSKPVLKAKTLNAQAPAPNASRSASSFVVMKDAKADDSSHKPSTGAKPTTTLKPKASSIFKRTAFGSKSTDKKENDSKEGSVVTTSSDSLRLNRPRPRGRNPPSQARPIRV